MPVNELNVMLCCQKNHQWWHLGCRDAKSDLNRCIQELCLKRGLLTNRPGKPHHCRDQPELLAEQVFDAQFSHLLGLRLPLPISPFQCSYIVCFRKWPLGGGIINHGGTEQLVGIRDKGNTFVGI